MKKVWLITGSSRGLGHVWASAALERGDAVIATARTPEMLDELAEKHKERILAVPLDVTDRQAVRHAIERGQNHFGRIDIVLNNAGYGLFCPIENAPETESRAIFETNFFGSLSVIQEILPLFRAQKSGHVIQISSIAGLLALPGLGLYNATKWATEGLLETLYHEVKSFGINVSIIEPGPHETEWIGKSSVRPETNVAYPSSQDYMVNNWPRLTLSSPQNSIAPLFELVDAKEPPLRLLLGGQDLQPEIIKTLNERIDSLTH